MTFSSLPDEKKFIICEKIHSKLLKCLKIKTYFLRQKLEFSEHDNEEENNAELLKRLKNAKDNFRLLFEKQKDGLCAFYVFLSFFQCHISEVQIWKIIDDKKADDLFVFDSTVPESCFTFLFGIRNSDNICVKTKYNSINAQLHLSVQNDGSTFKQVMKFPFELFNIV